MNERIAGSVLLCVPCGFLRNATKKNTGCESTVGYSWVAADKTQTKLKDSILQGSNAADQRAGEKL